MWHGVSPVAVAKIVEALKTSGIDLAAMLNRSPAEKPDEQQEH